MNFYMHRFALGEEIFNMKGISRRLFGKTAAASMAAAFSEISFPKTAFGQPQPDGASLRYPKGFFVGLRDRGVPD